MNNKKVPKGFECATKKGVEPLDFKEPVMPMEVAGEVTQFLLGKYGQHVESSVVLEGLLLSMQMLGGPRNAAQVVNYCAIKAA